MNLVLEIIARKRCRMFRMGLARIASQNNNFNFVFGQFASLVCSGILLQSTAAQKIRANSRNSF